MFSARHSNCNFEKLFRPKYESDPRWLRDDYRAKNEGRVILFHQTLGLRTLIQDLRREAISALSVWRCSEDLSNPSAVVGQVRFHVVELGKQLSAATALLELAENSEDFQIAVREYAPILQLVAERDASEEKARLDRQRREADVLQAREAAHKRAMDTLESDPAVVQAKRKLAEAEAAADGL